MSDKTEEPTPRKLAKAREKGDVAVSAFASQALSFLVAVALVPSAVIATSTRAAAMFRDALGGTDVWSSNALAHDVMFLVAPLLCAVAATSALATVVQTGGSLRPGVRARSREARFDRGVALARERTTAVERSARSPRHSRWATWPSRCCARKRQLRARARTNRRRAPWRATRQTVARRAAFVGLAFAIVDLLVTRRAFFRKLRMTKAEVKREHRESEGDPQLKAARHRAHHEMLAAATVNAVREATVVIVNPQHLATALRYVDGEDEAPKVVANGDGDLARRIQEAARAYGIPSCATSR